MKLVGGTLILGTKALLLVAFATLIIAVFRAALGAVNLVTIVYLLPVVVAALRWGTWPAIAAAIAGAAAADFFFYPPLYSFWISDTQNVADLIVFLIIAVVSGNLAADLRRREQEIEGLYQFSRRLVACYTTSDLIRATQSYLSESLMRPTVVIEGELLGDASAADTVVPRDVQNRARALVSSGEPAAQRIFDVATRHVWLVRPVSIGATRYVVLVDLGTSAIGTKRRLNRRLDAILADAANSLVRLDLAEALEELKLQGQSDTLKTALVATMSHELRNPLVSIVGAASVLEQMTEVQQNIRARSLVETVHDEAVRLDDNIKNLIDAAIITTGVERAGAELCDPVDMIHAAIELKRIQLAGHKIEVTLAPDLPLVRVQSALMENALGQLLDNAAKYSPANSTIKIEGRADKEWLTLSISDQGAGLTAAEHTHVGQRSFRGARHTAIRGSGLGLWIASTFVAANGGRLDAESPGPGLGTTIRIRLPATHGMGQD